MRVRWLGLAALLLPTAACGAEGATAPPVTAPAPSLTGAMTLERSPDSGQVDRVGADDGALHADGVKDLSFVMQVDGPLVSVFLVSVDDQGKPTGQYQADTLVGDAIGPAELGAKPGSGTSGLGVAEGDKMLNKQDGSLPPLAAGLHRLTLYVADSATLKSAKKLRVYVQRPDQSLVAGGTLAN
jgi:hypothetical protein